MKLARELNNNKNNNRLTVINKNSLEEEEEEEKENNSRFCKSCHLGLVKKPTGVYSCPRCNVSAIKRDTYPTTTLRPTFPTFSQYEPTKIHVLQSEDQKLPRSKLYFKRRQMQKNEEENKDPYLAILKGRGDIHITNLEYYSVDDDDDD